MRGLVGVCACVAAFLFALAPAVAQDSYFRSQRGPDGKPACIVNQASSLDRVYGADGVQHDYFQAAPDPGGCRSPLRGVFGRVNDQGQWVVPIAYGSVWMLSPMAAVVTPPHADRPFFLFDIATQKATPLKLDRKYDPWPVRIAEDRKGGALYYFSVGGDRKPPYHVQPMAADGQVYPGFDSLQDLHVDAVRSLSGKGEAGGLEYFLEPHKKFEPLYAHLFTLGGVPVLPDERLAISYDRKTAAIAVALAPDTAHLPSGHIFRKLQPNGEPAPLAPDQIGSIWYAMWEFDLFSPEVETADVFLKDGRFEYHIGGGVYLELISGGMLEAKYRDDHAQRVTRLLVGRLPSGKWRPVQVASRGEFATAELAFAAVDALEADTRSREKLAADERRKAGDRSQIIADYEASFSSGPNGYRNPGDGLSLRQKAELLGGDYLVRYARRYGAAEPGVAEAACKVAGPVDCGEIQRAKASADLKAEMDARAANEPQFVWSDAAAARAVASTVARMDAELKAMKARDSALASAACDRALAGANVSLSNCR